PMAPPENKEVPQDVVRHQRRQRPLETFGASTGPWLRQYFKAIEVPVFRDPRIALVGAREAELGGYDAVEGRYRVTIGDSRLVLSVFVIDGVHADKLSGGKAIEYGEAVFHLYDVDGTPAVTFIDEDHIGYAFSSERLTARELVQLVTSSNIV